MPIVEIDITSLEIHHSFLIDAFRMDFNVILWTEELKAAVVEDLQRLQERVNLNQIQVDTNYKLCPVTNRYKLQYKNFKIQNSLWIMNYGIIEHKLLWVGTLNVLAVMMFTQISYIRSHKIILTVMS